MTDPGKPESDPSSHDPKGRPPGEADAGEGRPGPAREVLRRLGDLVPGLGALLRGLEGSEAFRERLAQADEEVESRLRGGGPPPATNRPGDPRLRRPPPGGPPRPRGPLRGGGGRTGEGRPVREAAAEVFEEGDRLRVVAEMAGAEEESIRVHLRGDRLLVAAQSPLWSYRQWVPLPGEAKSIQKTSYRNGVLEVMLVRG